MALTVVTSGTLTLTAVTETNLELARRPGAATSYVYVVDVGALVAGESIFLRIYTVLLASGTERLAYVGSYIGGADLDPMQFSVPIPVDTGTGITIRASLELNNWTTNRNVPWKLFSL